MPWEVLTIASRLAAWAILNANIVTGFFVLCACVCTSFSAINVATSKRSPVTPYGNPGLSYVADLCLKKPKLWIVFLPGLVGVGGCAAKCASNRSGRKLLVIPNDSFVHARHVPQGSLDDRTAC